MPVRGGRIVTAADDYVADLYVEDETVTVLRWLRKSGSATAA